MLPIRDQLPTRAPPFVNYALIAINVAVFAAQALTSGDGDGTGFGASWALVPAEVVAHPLASAPALLGHMFLHGSLLHVGGNMLFLWIFGDNVEDALGHVRYAIFYLLCGLAAAGGQIAVGPHATVPMLGASGAISGVLAAYGVLYPRSPIAVVNPIPLLWLFWGVLLWLPAWFVILEYFVANLWNAFGANAARSGIAFAAHVGGFVAGLALLPILRRHDAVAHPTWSRLVGPRRFGDR